MVFQAVIQAVSYTHLVATSELELYLLKDDELEAFVADIRTSLGGENENAIIAVSYTHLDVYKRQKLRSILRICIRGTSKRL